MNSTSVPFRNLSCPVRMFIVNLCLHDQDLARFVTDCETHDCGVAHNKTTLRAALHRLCAKHDDLGKGISDLLDLRHVDVVAHVRSQSPDMLTMEWHEIAQTASGNELAAWGWALTTDARQEVVALAQRMMFEIYVRGLQSLVSRACPE